VVAVSPDLQERDLVAVADVETYSLEYLIYLTSDDRAAILGRTDRVI